MKNCCKKHIDTKKTSEGSSLAIALFFFMVCSLMCAGILYLANSTYRGVSKSYSYAQYQNQNYVSPPPPPPTAEPTATPTPDPLYQAEEAAIDLIYQNLNYDFYNAFLQADKGVTTNLYNTPSNMTYEILSYIHSFYGVPAKVPLFDDKDGFEKVFTYDCSGIQLQIVVYMTGTTGSKQNNGLRFHYFKITVKAADPACTYEQVIEYTADSGKDGKFYFVWSSSGGKHFSLKPNP